MVLAILFDIVLGLQIPKVISVCLKVIGKNVDMEELLPFT
jgi:hypothetical protein